MKYNTLQNCEELGVSHNPEIRKKVLIDNRSIAGITQFAQAVFPPGAIAGAHRHPDITEVFFIESGQGEIRIDGSPLALAPGACITVSPGEEHELENTGAQDLVVTYFGVSAAQPD